MHILAIINPVSGVGSKDKIPRLIETVVDNEKNDVSIVMSEYAGHAHEIAEMAVAEGIDVVYPEMKGKYIWDIITEIYNWWRFDYPRLESERSYLLSFCCDYCWGSIKSRKKDEEYSELVFDRSKCPKTLEDFDGKDVNWDVIDKYCDGDRKNVLVERFISGKLDELERRIENEKQKYLHLCVEVRPYLWT